MERNYPQVISMTTSIEVELVDDVVYTYGNVTGVAMNQPWYCTNCGVENHPDAFACFECRVPRPPHTYPQGYASAPGMGYGPPPVPGTYQPQYPPLPQRRTNALAPVLITCGVLVLIVLVVGGMAALALPNYVKVKEKAKEAEVKANLHNIQLSVERFAVDHGGNYPQYLIGGEAKCANEVNASMDTGPESAAQVFQQVTDCPLLEKVSDPLLREGYITEYPRNPFTRNGAAIHLIQSDLSSTPGGCDPMRNGCDTGLAHGTRFGPYCTSMGSVLADMRFPQAFVEREGGQAPLEFASGADTEYQYWDMWYEDKPLPFMPGMFFYKSIGPIIVSAEEAAQGSPADEVGQADQANFAMFQLMQPDQYILGAYGGMRTKGKDILGAEEPFVGPDGQPEWMYLRSEVSTSPDNVQGCPYVIKAVGGKVDEIQYGNPNGIRDSIILVLTAGEDYSGNP
jgi:hypothetical protein